MNDKKQKIKFYPLRCKACNRELKSGYTDDLCPVCREASKQPPQEIID